MTTGFATPSADLDLIKIGEARKSLVGVKLDQVMTRSSSFVGAAFKQQVLSDLQNVHYTCIIITLTIILGMDNYTNVFLRGGGGGVVECFF